MSLLSSTRPDGTPKETSEICYDGVQLGMMLAILLVVAAGVAIYLENGRKRAEPRTWTLETNGGMPLKFTGVVIGEARQSMGYDMTLYRTNDGQYIFSRSFTSPGGRLGEANRWVVMGDHLPTSQQIVDVAGWSETTKDLLKDAGLPTEASLPPR